MTMVVIIVAIKTVGHRGLEGLRHSGQRDPAT
jgi:hypothetical protein